MSKDPAHLPLASYPGSLLWRKEPGYKVDLPPPLSIASEGGKVSSGSLFPSHGKPMHCNLSLTFENKLTGMHVCKEEEASRWHLLQLPEVHYYWGARYV